MKTEGNDDYVAELGEIEITRNCVCDNSMHIFLSKKDLSEMLKALNTTKGD